MSSSPSVSALFKECASIFAQLPAPVFSQKSAVRFFVLPFQNKILFNKTINTKSEQQEACNKFLCYFSLFFSTFRNCKWNNAQQASQDKWLTLRKVSLPFTFLSLPPQVALEKFKLKSFAYATLHQTRNMQMAH